LEAGPSRGPRIGVDAIVIARKPVEERLYRQRLVRDHAVGLPFGRADRATHRRRSSWPPEASLAAQEQPGAGAEPQLPGLGVGRVPLRHDERAGTLVVDADDATAHDHRARRRDRAEHLDALVAVHDGFERHVAELRERETRAGDADAYRERREDAERDALRVLRDGFEIVP